MNFGNNSVNIGSISNIGARQRAINKMRPDSNGLYGEGLLPCPFLLPLAPFFRHSFFLLELHTNTLFSPFFFFNGLSPFGFSRRCYTSLGNVHRNPSPSSTLPSLAVPFQFFYLWKTAEMGKAEEEEKERPTGYTRTAHGATIHTSQCGKGGRDTLPFIHQGPSTARPSNNFL